MHDVIELGTVKHILYECAGLNYIHTNGVGNVCRGHLWVEWKYMPINDKVDLLLHAFHSRYVCEWGELYRNTAIMVNALWENYVSGG